jgi:hypothetical protein
VCFDAGWYLHHEEESEDDHEWDVGACATAWMHV